MINKDLAAINALIYRMKRMARRRQAEGIYTDEYIVLRAAHVIENLIDAARHTLEYGEMECSKSTNGIGSCYENGMKEGAIYYADRVCNSCRTWKAIHDGINQSEREFKS